MASFSERRLRRELGRLAALGAALLLAAAWGLAVIEGPAMAAGWWLMALVCWGFVLWQCHKRLHLNHAGAGEPLYPTLGRGNRVTLLRGWLIAATAGFLLTPHANLLPWLGFVPAALYTAAALGDALDGYLARRQHQTTRLGAELDTVLDAFGLLVAPLLAVHYGKLHISYLLVSLAYYLFQWGIYWRGYRGRAVFPLPPSRLRRPLAGVQMALVASALWPPLPAEMTRILGLVFMLPLLLGFGRDWLHVSGRLGARTEPCE